MSKTRNHELTGFQEFLSSSVVQIVVTLLLMLFLFGSSALIAYQSGRQKQISETNREVSEEKFCGGIAGVICPKEYTCKLDGKYPDAGGVCIKK